MIPSSFSDPEFIKFLKQKDGDAWGDVYSAIAPKLQGFIRRKVSNFKTHWDVNATTEDIVQITFEKALKNIHSYNPEKSALESWMFNIADRTFIDFARKLQSDKSRMKYWLESFIGTREQTVATVAELSNNMKINIGSFTEKQKLYLYMFFIQEWSDDLIAEKMKVSRNAVVKARSRLLSQLRNLLEKNSA